MSTEENGGLPENRQEPIAEPGDFGPGGRIKNRVHFLALLVLLSSFVGGFFGGHYGETRKVEPYTGPRSATGLPLPTAGEAVAGLWGAVPTIMLGGLVGCLARWRRVRMDVSPVSFGVIVGGVVGFLAGHLGGITYTCLYATIAGGVIAALLELLGYCAGD